MTVYAEDLARKVRLSFPTRVVARLVETDKVSLGSNHAQVKGYVQKLLGNAEAKGLRLGELPFAKLRTAGDLHTALFGSGGGASLADWFDLDEGWWIALALSLALAALIALLYVLYAAPLLLAEVALDAAVMSGVYRRLRRDDARHWTSGVLRHTWIPALVIVVCATGVGFAAHEIAPEARSIGSVIRALALP